MLMVAVALGVVTAAAVVALAVHRHRRDDLSLSVRAFADYRARLAAAEQGRVPRAR